jgi:hypothetical protein
MNTNNNEKLRCVSMKNGLICIDFKPQTDIKDTFKHESIDNTKTLFSNNKIVSLPMYHAIPKKDNTHIEFYPSMSVNDYNNKQTNNKPLTVLEYCLKGLKLNLDKSACIDLSNKINLSSSNDTIQIRNILIPIMNIKGIGKTLDLRIWINKKDISNINIDDKVTTVSELYNAQQKEQHEKTLRIERNKRYYENKKNGIIKTIVSCKDYLSIHEINHIGKRDNLPIHDLWINSTITTQYDINGKCHIVSLNKLNTITVSDDSVKYANAYLKLHNHRINVKESMTNRLNNFFNTHKHRVITAIDQNRQKQIAIRKIQELKAIQLNRELTVYANTQKSSYELKIHECNELELIEISYSKHLSMIKHLESMSKDTTIKAKHNMHN